MFHIHLHTQNPNSFTNIDLWTDRHIMLTNTNIPTHTLY